MAEVGDGASAFVEASHEETGLVVIAIAGELDISNVESVSMAIEAAVDERTERVAFDLEKLTFMDSSGIALLLKFTNRIGSVHVRNPTSIVRRVIEATGLAATFGMSS